MKTRILTIAVSIAVLPISSLAASSYGQMAEERFKAADTNKDGKLTKKEAKKGMPRVHTNFDRIDGAKRGYVTLEQVKAMIAAATN